MSLAQNKANDAREPLVLMFETFCLFFGSTTRTKGDKGLVGVEPRLAPESTEERQPPDRSLTLGDVKKLGRRHNWYASEHVGEYLFQEFDQQSVRL